MGWFQVDFFLEKDICHDHEIDILRTLTNLQLRYVLKNVLFQQILILGNFHKIDVFVFFWAKHKPQLKIFYRDIVYII